jgi:HPt (histidine-containing phosphotransfer) domain-containing protein
MSNKLDDVLKKYVRDKQPPEVIEKAVKEHQAKFADGGETPHMADFQSNVYLQGKLRTDFAKSQKNIYNEIRNAIASQDTETAQLLLHTLKGLAALIREPELSQAAQEAESLIMQGKICTDDKLNILKTELERVFNSIRQTKITESDNIVNKSEALSILDELIPLLELRKNESINLIERIRTIPETAIMVTQIQKFHFKAALENAKTLRAMLGE